MKSKTKKAIIISVSAVLAAIIAVSGVLYAVLIGREGEKPTFQTAGGMEFVSQFKAGINLGNSLTAFDESKLAYNSGDLSTETSWGCPKVTPEQMQMFADSGMQIVRIGVTWGPHMTGAPDYKIDDEWMARVKEVVDYALDAGMYAIINVMSAERYWHIPNEENYAAATDAQDKIWRQIGKAFADYDEHLLFEAINEPRVYGSFMEWKGGTAAERQTLNKLNFDFVETVRSLGGNNAERYLLIPTYAAAGYKKQVDSMAIPDDERVIVSIHDYYEYEFCQHTENTKKTEWGTASEKKKIDKYMDYIGEAFTKRNIPVMFTEFGCVDKNNDAERAEWIEYTMKSANRYGMPMLWWDNGIPQYQYEYGGAFGLFDREKCAVTHPELVDALNCLK